MAKDKENLMKKKPLISCCYITKQAEDFLWYSMRSVYDYCDEIIVVDDMSTDSTVDIVKSFPEKKVRLFRDNFNCDKRQQRNFYLAKASGIFLHIVDDDEIYESTQLDWLRKFIQSSESNKYNEIFFRMLWFWKSGDHVIHGHHWDQRFETFFRNIPGLKYDIHHAVSLNGNLLCKGPSYLTDAVVIYHYSHCKSEKKIREKIKYYMLRDNPNVNPKNVNLFVNKHPHFSGNFDQPRYGPQGLLIAGTVGSQRDVVTKYGGKHPEVMKGHPLVMKNKGTLEEYKKNMNAYMEGHWQFHNHLNHTRHTNRIRYTSEFCIGRTVEIGCADGTGTKIMMDWRVKDIPEKVSFEGVEPTDWGFSQAVKKHPDIKFTKAMGEQLPFKDGEFDTVLLAEVIEHCLNPEVFLKECARICKKRLILTTPNGSHDDPDHKRFYTPITISQLMNPYLINPPKIFGLTVTGERCFDFNTLYFMLAVGKKIISG